MTQCFRFKSSFLGNINGQSTLFVLIALITLVSFSLATIHWGMKKNTQMQLQLAADASVTSGVLWEARTYNVISAMNQGILIVVAAALIGAMVLVALMACAATVVGAFVCGPILDAVWDPITKFIQYAWEIGVALSQMERWFVKFAWVPILLGTYMTGKKNHVDKVLPYPFIPEIPGMSGILGNHDKESTLTLHTKDGGFEVIIENVIDAIWKDAPGIAMTAFKGAAKFLEKLFSSMDTPDPLVLDDDFRPRMKLKVTVWKKFSGEKMGLNAQSEATPFLPGTAYGEEDLFDMNWHAKLQPIDPQGNPF